MKSNITRNYGLYGAKMLRCLQNINATKCNPPLDDGEVKDIARLFDKNAATKVLSFQSTKR